MATTEANMALGTARGLVGGSERVRKANEPMTMGARAPRSVHEQVRELFEVVDRRFDDQPAVARAALRAILALEPSLSRARELLERMRTGVGAAPSRPDDSPGTDDGWIDEAEFFIAQDLFSDAYESLREAALASPSDPRVADWLAFIEAEQRGRNPSAPGNGGV